MWSLSEHSRFSWFPTLRMCIGPDMPQNDSAEGMIPRHSGDPTVGIVQARCRGRHYAFAGKQTNLTHVLGHGKISCKVPRDALLT